MNLIRSAKGTKLLYLLRTASERVRRGDVSSLTAYARRYVPSPETRRLRTEYRSSLRMTLRGWLGYHQSEIAFDQCTWMGVRAWKNPLDAWIYQEILYEVRPDVVVEVGSAIGGGTLYLAHILDLLGTGTVISVDIDRSRFEVSHPRIVTVTGDSSAPETVEEVASRCEGKRVLVIHDADHRRDKVLADLACYGPLVSVGSYLIVEDGIVDLFRPHELMGVSYAGPLAATEEFLRTSLGAAFVVDPSRERYLLTYNPRGFLRRIR